MSGPEPWDGLGGVRPHPRIKLRGCALVLVRGVLWVLTRADARAAEVLGTIDSLRFPPNLRDAFCICWNGTGSTSVRHMQGGAPSPITIDPDYPREITLINRNLTIAASILFAVHYACGPAKAASESERLAAQLEQIYQATKDSQDREIVAAASVISTLVGALQSHRTLELSDFVLPFSQSEVDRLQEEIKRRRGL